jgi:predicted DNA-binding protein with PD1-like motif
MKYKLLSEREGREFVLVFDPGDEVASLLLQFAEQEKLGFSRLLAVGAFSDVAVGYFDLKTKEYLPIRIEEQVEVTSLIGNIARFEGKPKLHAHVTIGKRDGTVHGGHLLSAHVRPTLELFLTEWPARLVRTFNTETNIPLIDINASS